MALDIRLHFTSRYHPEKDSQMEYTNKILEQYLCVYYNYQQDNWSNLFLLIEFAYNNTSSTTTGMSPFFANKGYHSNITIYLKRDITSFYACEFAINLNKLQNSLKTEISTTQQQY